MSVMGESEQREELTYATATPDQVAQVRDEVRRKLAEADARHTPEYWARLREQLGLPPKAA
jgi:crotonobetainyl-CoA:carnitine CoA-transferase CaiB-like acyl-CoA transferase